MIIIIIIMIIVIINLTPYEILNLSVFNLISDYTLGPILHIL